MKTLPKIFLVTFFLHLFTLIAPHRTLVAQSERNGIKLVVVLVIDQFRYEFLDRFKNFYSDSGFQWIKKTGTNFSNASFKHAVTTTAPGHAAISTGCYAGRSGIISNSWYSREKQKVVNSVEDTTVALVGAAGLSSLGKKSPTHLLVTTVGDELKNVSPQSKVVGISFKDRAAILLAGKKADAAYWFDDRTGVFVTSTYYMKEVPLWFDQFNNEKHADRYFGKEWTRYVPEQKYSICDVDDVPYESDENALGRAFPHTISGGVDSPQRSYYQALRSSPFGNELLFNFAQQVIIGEQLGSRGYTDILNISLSSIDYIGHSYGPDSQEFMDACIRLDRQVAAFFQFLNTITGIENCEIILTADHGTASIPEYLIKQKKDAGRIDPEEFKLKIESGLTAKYASPSKRMRWIEAEEFPWLYINREVLSSKNLTLGEFETALRSIIDTLPGISGIASRHEIEFGRTQSDVTQKLKYAYNKSRSGDYYILVKAGYIFTSDKTGTSHGSVYEYDSHVPLIIRSPKISRGMIHSNVGLADIAPTIAKSLAIPFANERDGHVLPVKISFEKKVKMRSAK